MTKLIAPSDATSFGCDGEIFEVKRGRVDLPEHLVAVALEHGYKHPSDKAAEAADAPADAPVDTSVDTPVAEG